ncbi:MAG: hypothetical protein ACRDGI_02675 [Candidatus Limnocylindrales bacterium]
MSEHANPQRPAGMCLGPGHLVVYGNPAFVAMFGGRCVGMPARETMLGLPAEAFDLLDAVLAESRPLARWIAIRVEDWRLTAMPRLDFETGQAYGVSFHLRRRTDLPVVRSDRPAGESRQGWLSPPSR